jgi:hypothetical protein
MVVNTYQNYILYQIANAQIRPWPWPHVVLNQLFHTDQYNQILNNLPSTDVLTDIRTTKKHPDYYSPFRFILLKENYTQFWNDLQNQFLNGQLKQILLNKFSNQLDSRLCNHKHTVEFYDTFQLTLDKPGYKLISHEDAFNKIFTLVCNLPKNNNQINQGTVIYTGQNTEILFSSPYTPNTAFGVFRAENGWHGVEPVIEDRWTIQYTIWGKDKE